MSHITQKGAFSRPPFFISYFITDPQEFGDTVELFEQNLRKTFETHHIDMICFRDKTSKNKETLAKKCLEISREYKIRKVLINSDLELCLKYNFDGIHLNSQQFNLLKTLQDNRLYKVISCHNTDEIKEAKAFNADAITYSPIFFKEKKGEPKGLENLKNVVKCYQTESFEIFALGGIITNENVQDVLKTGAKGFASIRYFKV